MNLEEFNIIIFVTGMILGAIVSLAVKSFTAKNSNKQPMSHSSTVTIKSLQQELDKKQVIIDNFFSDSNEQLIATEKRLAELRKTLTSGATQLSNITVAAHTSTNIESNEADSAITFEPPRDYALKSDEEQGMLSENFGLNDKPENLEPARTI